MSEPSREELRAWDREIVWHAFTQMSEYEPFIIERAHGCTLVDLEGREYIDAVSSLWCNLHGHRHPRLDAALAAQLGKVAHATSLGASNPTTIRLAKRLVELAPAGLEHVFFSDDGATAIEVALKMSLQYWRQRLDPKPEKTKYVVLSEAYHGDTIGSVSLGGVERFHRMFEPLLFETIRVATPNLYRRPSGVSIESAATHYLAEMESVLREHHRQIAGVVIEPLVQCAAGLVMHPPGYLKGLRELTRRHDVLLIADEVAVGFGRTGKLFASEHEAVSPDLLCLAKGITAGYLPMAATLTTNEIFRAFLGDYRESKTFYHGHTYGGNPLAAAVALESLAIFDDERVLETLQPKIARLAKHLARIGQLAHVGNVRQRGFIAGIDLVRDRATGEPYAWEEKRGIAVCQHARELGVFVRPLGNVIVIMPPLAISDAELDRVLEVVEQSIMAVCGA